MPGLAAPINLGNVVSGSAAVPSPTQASYFYGRISGWIVPSATGPHKIGVNCADGCNLYIGTQAVLALLTNKDVANSTLGYTQSDTITLTKGIYYPIVIEWQHGSGTAYELQLIWTPPLGSAALIPNTNLTNDNQSITGILDASFWNGTSGLWYPGGAGTVDFASTAHANKNLDSIPDGTSRSLASFVTAATVAAAVAVETARAEAAEASLALGGGGAPAVPWFEVAPPSSPSIWDDEFNVNTLDPKWTPTGSPAYNDVDNVLPSHAYVECNAASTQLNLTQAFAPGAVDFSILVKFRGRPTTQFGGCFVTIGTSGFSSFLWAGFENRTGGTTPNATVYDGTTFLSEPVLADVQTIYFYIQRWNSASSARYTFWFSYDGFTWFNFLDSTGNTLTAASLQIVMGNESGNGVPHSYACDYIRFNQNLNLPVNPSGSFSSTARL